MNASAGIDRIIAAFEDGWRAADDRSLGGRTGAADAALTGYWDSGFAAAVAGQPSAGDAPVEERWPTFH